MMCKIFSISMMMCLVFLLSACPNNNLGFLAKPLVIDPPDISRCTRCPKTEEEKQNAKVAFIVEPRALDILPPIIKTALDALSDEWIIQIFHGLNNEKFIRESKLLAPYMESGRVVLSRIHQENFSVSYYSSQIILNPYFWENVLGEYALTFETDSVFCGNGSVEPYLQYDIIGAPWNRDYSCYLYNDPVHGNLRHMKSIGETTPERLRQQGFTDVRTIRPVVGNGGFTLRKRSKMLEILRKYDTDSSTLLYISSDIFIAAAAIDLQASVPSEERARSFSVENVFFSRPFGVHKPWLYLSSSELDELGQNCPAMNEILKPYYEPRHGWGK